jgi:hypothetical protein
MARLLRARLPRHATTDGHPAPIRNARRVAMTDDAAPYMDQDSVYWNWPVQNGTGPAGTVRFKATTVRQERTGPHAVINIGWGSSRLEYDAVNLHKREDRTRLANAAHGRLPEGIRTLLSKDALAALLGEFCEQVWPIWVDAKAPLYVVGMAERTAPAFSIYPYVITGGGTILFGAPGAGKSYLSMLMAVSMEHGIQTLWKVKQAKVLYINLERSEESVQQRLGAVNRALGLEPTEPLYILNARGASLADVAEITRERVRQEKIDVVMLDSISRAGFGDLTENGPVNKIMDTLNGIAHTWFALAHTPRAEGANHVYGSQMFDTAADIMVQQLSQRNEREIGIGLKITKANDIGKTDMQIVGLTFDEMGLTGVRPASIHDFPELGGSADMSNADRIALYLSEWQSGKPIGDIIGDLAMDRARTSSILNADPRFQSSGGEPGKPKIWMVK